MKEEYAYLLKTDEEISSYLKLLRVPNRKIRSEVDLKNLCFETISQGNVNLMIRIIDRYPILLTHINTNRNSNNYTALQAASINNHPEMVEFLISRGSDDSREAGYLTALELICLNSKTISNKNTTKIIKLLLTLANPTEVNTLLEFLSNNQESYPGVYEIFLPLVQEFRIQQFPDDDEVIINSIDGLKEICKDSDIPFDAATIELIKEILNKLDSEEVHEYAQLLKLTPNNRENAILTIIDNFIFEQALYEFPEHEYAAEDTSSLRIKTPFNSQEEGDNEQPAKRAKTAPGEFNPSNQTTTVLLLPNDLDELPGSYLAGSDHIMDS